MPISVECGSCRAVLDLPHGAGRRRILCPHCGDKLDVRAAADEPRAQAGDHDDPGDRADGPPSRPASVLASAGLLCGCTALCFASVPALSFLTKPLSILGLALVVAAWVRGAARREPLGRLTPFAAAVCLPV